jgi:hypothetical protein
VNYTPGIRSTADYTGEADTNFVSSQAIFDSILAKEQEDTNGLNGFLLLLHLGSGPSRADKFHPRFGSLMDYLASKEYQFVRADELLEGREVKGPPPRDIPHEAGTEDISAARAAFLKRYGLSAPSSAPTNK